jgi:hypothetical protein
MKMVSEEFHSFVRGSLRPVLDSKGTETAVSGWGQTGTLTPPETLAKKVLSSITIVIIESGGKKVAF